MSEVFSQELIDLKKCEGNFSAVLYRKVVLETLQLQVLFTGDGEIFFSSCASGTCIGD